jgi:hypothetical protein
VRSTSLIRGVLQRALNVLTRLGEFLRGGNETAIGVLIVAVTIFGAYVTWRAADAAGAAADFDQRARQAYVFSDQLSSQHREQVAYERRLFESFRAHVRVADALERDASQIRRRAGSRANDMLYEARVNRAVARALEVPFAGASPVDDPVDGVEPGDPFSRPYYDGNGRLQILIDDDSALQELSPTGLRDAAGEARTKRFALVAVDTAVIASIFFLTLALLAARMRQHFAVGGTLLVAAAAVSFVVVQIVIDVPTL